MESNLSPNAREYITNIQLDEFKEIIMGWEPNYKSVNELRRMLSKLDRQIAIEWGVNLIQSLTIPHQVAGAILLENEEYFRKDLQFIYDKILAFSDSENWNVRQVAVDLFEQLIHNNVDNWENFLDECVNSDDPHFRRLALLTSNEIARSAKYENDLKLVLLRKIEDLIYDKDPYVVPIIQDVFGEGYMRNCPELTLQWIEDKLSSIDNAYAKSTLVNITASRHTREHTDRALQIIDLVLSEDDPQIKKARSSALHNLAVKQQSRVTAFLESRMNIKQAVEHWAELGADGSLDEFDF